MTTTKAAFTRLIDYGMTDKGVAVDWQNREGSHRHTFTSEDLAGALWDCGHADGYGMLNGEVVCFMDGRPGFASTALPSEVWSTLVGIDRQAVCLELIFQHQKSNEL